MIRDVLPFLATTESEAADQTTDQTGTDGEDASSEATPEATENEKWEVREATEDTALGSVADAHQSIIAPSSLEERTDAVRIGDDWARTLWVGEYPDIPRDGLLEQLYAGGETQQTDISIHLQPRDTHATLDTLENRIEELQADYEYLADRQRAGARGIQKDLEDHQALYDALRNTSMTAFDVATYLTVRTDSRDALDTAVDGVTATARQAPANLTPVTPRWSQRPAFTAGSPVARDRLNDELETQTPMLAGAVGAMFPFVAGTFAEPGIEYGTYALNESPLVLDRFNRETGYCMMVIGKLGAGKSFASKLQLVRRAMFDQDSIIVMLDPLQGFAGVNDTLDGEQITVGGTRGLNPLEIRAPPEETLASTDDLDPWAAQITKVMGFFETFFSAIANNPLDDRSQTLRRAVQEAYDRKGITRDPATHTNESPTVRDVIAVLEDLLESPESYGYITQGEQEQVQAQAQSLLTDLRPSFRGAGDLANLAKSTEFDLDSKVVYLDLHQQEGVRGPTETSLMMQVLFNIVYERAKQSDKRIVFAIDEAHYLFNDSTSLSFLETAVRHSRHYDLSIQFITQTGGEFALTPEARTIANLCSLTLLHRVDEADETLAEWFDLSQRQINWVQTAKAGEDSEGFSEALLGIDEEGWFPIRIHASPFETDIIEGDR